MLAAAGGGGGGLSYGTRVDQTSGDGARNVGVAPGGGEAGVAIGQVGE